MICESEWKVIISKNWLFELTVGGLNKGESIELLARYKTAVIKIGNNVATNKIIMLCAVNYLEIGNYILIGQCIIIMDNGSHEVDSNKKNNRINS